MRQSRHESDGFFYLCMLIACRAWTEKASGSAANFSIRAGIGGNTDDYDTSTNGFLIVFSIREGRPIIVS